MTIERLGQIDPLQNSRKATPSNKAHEAKETDQVSVSNEAREKGEVFQAFEIAKQTPDVRMDRIAELKAKINDPDYMNEAVISMTADSIIDQLFS